MKIITTTSVLAAFASASVLLMGTACSPKGGGAGEDGSTQVLRAFPENAEVAMYFDQAAISESAFSEAVQNLEDDFPEEMQSEEISERFEEITGLEDDDITDFALAISGLENVQMDPSQLKISGGIFAKEAVTADQVVAAIQFIADQNNQPIQLTVTPGDEADFITFPAEPGAPEIHAAVVTGDSSTILFFGDKASVEASLARETGSVPAGLQAPSEGLIDGQQGWISIVLPESIKAQLAGMTSQGEQMIRGLSKLNSLQSIGVGMKSSDSLDVAIGLNLGSEEDAAAIETILNNQLISFAKMMLSSGTPEPLPLLNSLTASHSGDRAVLSLMVTVEDIRILQAQLINMIPTGAPMGVTPSAQ